MADQKNLKAPSAATVREENLVPVDWENDDWKEMGRESVEYLSTFSAAQLEEIFPVGLKTPAAIFLRLQAECGFKVEGPITAAHIHAFVMANREKPDYAAGVGHKRAVLMAFLGIAIAACSADDTKREVSEGMQAVLDDVYSPHWRVQLIFLLRNSGATDADGADNTGNTTNITYLKGGETKECVIAAKLATGTLARWATVPWPTLAKAGKTGEKKKNRKKN